MTDVLKVECSRCSTVLKLKDGRMLGKTVRCPKCREKFVVELAGATHSQSDQLDVIDDGGFYDEPEDEWGDWDETLDEEEHRPRRRKQSKSKKGKKGKKKQREAPSRAAVLIISGGSLMLLLLGGISLLIVPKLFGAGSTDKLLWLPNDTQTYVEIRVAELWNAPSMKPLRTSELGQLIKEELDKRTKLSVDDIDLIVLGFPSSGQNPSYILHLTKPLDTSKLGEGFAEEIYAGRTIYTHEESGQSGFQLDETTLIGGSKPELQSAIDRRGSNEMADRFGHIPSTGDILFATAKLDPKFGETALKSVAGSGFDTSRISATSGTFKIDKDVNIEISLTFENQQAADEAMKYANDSLEEFKGELKAQQMDLQNESFLPSRQARAMVMKTQEIADSVVISQSGSEMKFKMKIPGFILESYVDALSGYGGLPPVGGGLGLPF